MKKYDIVEIVRKTIGPVEAVGETHADGRIKDNLKNYCELHDALLYDIITSATGMSGRYQYSVKEVSDIARQYLREIHEEIGEYLRQFEIEEAIEEVKK